MKRLLAALVTLAVACAPLPDARFASAAARAQAASASGRYAEAAELWLAAARTASSVRDRDEAEYRAALYFERAGAAERAEALYDRLARAPGERAARASFERARLVLRVDAERGHALLVAALHRYPESGLAPRALRQLLALVEARAGVPGALAEATRLLMELGASGLDEPLRYERARLLERTEDVSGARDAYLELAERHGYPEGALWDDALFRAAECEARLRRPTAAVALLERLLAEREPSSSLGSYERVRYAEARFRIAELFRDELADPARARREFRRVYREHATSLLRDDALWQEARVAVAMADEQGACQPLDLLVRDFRTSRYAACATRLCPSAPSVSGRPCHFASLPERPDGEGDGHSSSSSSSSP